MAKHTVLFGLSALLTLFLLISICFTLIAYVNYEMPSDRLINLTLYLMSQAIVYMIVIDLAMSKMKLKLKWGSALTIFIIVDITFFLGVVTCTYFILANGVFLNFFAHTLLYINITLMMNANWYFLRTFGNFKTTSKIDVSLLINIITMFSFLLILLNVPAGFYFKIDSVTETLSTSDTNWMSSLFPAVIYLITLYHMYKCNMSKKWKITLTSFSMLPFLGYGMVVVFHLTIEVPAIGSLLCALLLNGCIYRKYELFMSADESDTINREVSIAISQIQPHFLYNSLTSIMNIEGTPKETKEAIIDFGKYLRANLNTISLNTAVPFKMELERIENYERLEKLRYVDKIEYVHKIETKDFLVPPLSIETLVENAVKHGLSAKDSKGTVTLSTYEEGDNYYVIIEDNGVGFEPSKELENADTHIGLLNSEKRLRTIVGGSMIIKSQLGVGTVITVIIPKIK